MRQSAVLLAVIPVVVASCASGRSSATSLHAPGHTIALAAANLPRGFYRERRLVLSPTAAGIEEVGSIAYARHGGRPTIEDTFVPRVPSGQGVTFVATQVVPFRTISGARWGFAQLDRTLRRSGTVGTVQEAVHVGATATPLPTIIAIIKHPLPPPVSRYRPTHAPTGIGEQAAAYVNDSAAYAGEYVYTNRLVLFRRGTYCIVVHVAGNYNQVPGDAATRLARVLDRQAAIVG